MRISKEEWWWLQTYMVFLFYLGAAAGIVRPPGTKSALSHVKLFIVCEARGTHIQLKGRVLQSSNLEPSMHSTTSVLRQ
ncbi:hypothetical protein A0H81_13759 [Grifola frondosa]|uniref:Uncharacterized protein n=1 Tax=Grifola frondosa TaxID=5627 RepID=A0A1C7LND3_GRIFR|nr:hypothetical protein A0H81_13759 [Grifola frondosa]